MKEDQEPSGGALVPSASSALTRKSSGLVRRGLDDLLKGQSRIDSSEVVRYDPSEHLRKLGRESFINSLGMEFVLIPAGSFMMGSENGDPEERPVHRVSISQSFYMGKYEVTQEQWQAVMETNPSHLQGAKLPVDNVSWNDAQEFINKLNEMDIACKYRLPAEAEWEYACRAGTTGDYAGNLDDMAWYLDNSGHQTHPVGQKQPNAWGLYDMHGNVWEWCQDWQHQNYNGAPADESAWLSIGKQKERVLRGGSLAEHGKDVRSAARDWDAPDGRDDYSGFRVVAAVLSDTGTREFYSIEQDKVETQPDLLRPKLDELMRAHPPNDKSNFRLMEEAAEIGRTRGVEAMQAYIQETNQKLTDGRYLERQGDGPLFVMRK